MTGPVDCIPALSWVLSIMNSMWLWLFRSDDTRKKGLPSLPKTYYCTEDPYWTQAHADEHCNIERNMPLKIASGRVICADVIRFNPDNDVRNVAWRSKKKKAVLFLPGNPGLVDFYLVFLRQMFEQLGGKYYVMTVGHAGHSPWSHGRDSEPVSFQDQISHKIAFIEHEFPGFVNGSDEWELTIAGHSVGARIGLEVLQRLHGRVNIKQFFGLCPTVINIAKSPNGMKNTPLLANAPLRAAAFFLVQILSLVVAALPEGLCHSLAHMIMKNDHPGLDTYYVQHGIKLVDAHLIRNVLYMANDEMREILDHRDEAIQHATKYHQEKITFVLSPMDKWCCTNIVGDMKEAFDVASFKMLSNDVKHAFCLSHSNSNDVLNAMIEEM